MSRTNILPKSKGLSSGAIRVRPAKYQVKKTEFSIQALVKNAAKSIAPVWPLETFIACNPLHGFEDEPFEVALAKAGFHEKLTQNDSGLEAVNRQMIKWCASFFDAGQSTIEMPHRDQGFYLGFIKLARFDKTLHKNQKALKHFLLTLPQSSEGAIKVCLSRLQIPVSQQEEFLAQTLRYLPGWAGFVKWKADWSHTERSETTPATLMDFVAVRLVLTYLLWPNAIKVEKSTDDRRIKNIMKTLQLNENAYRKKLLNILLPQFEKNHVKATRRDAQFVFCIDVRSEPFRRSIESLGHYETFGFAGFFGIPIHTSEFGTEKNKDCCPVLLKPRFSVKEVAMVKNNNSLTEYEAGKTFINNYKNLYYQLKYNFSTPYALVESIGLWCGLIMAGKSLFPRLTKRALMSIKNWIAPTVATTVEHEIPEDDQISYAETVLRLMGLTSGFAKIIILCGHGSSTENNPYASALDCGACGGNHGGINARLLASILNKPEVRRGLEDRGMHIPLDTQFYGALHNTTTDSVHIYCEEGPKPIYPALLEQLRNDLSKASLKTNQERSLQFQERSSDNSLNRSVDWSETRPEWGLARNAAFIVAPRHVTKDLALDGRCFLHSYRWEEDEEGALLETILTAPMVVAEWINTQYLFSTLDNVRYGSGSKITHNVVGKLGIMQGSGSDLMHGLPLQSVMKSDQESYHEPQRLLAVVHAPRDRVAKVIDKHSILQKLFLNEWVHLLVIDPISNRAYQLDHSGTWISIK